MWYVLGGLLFWGIVVFSLYLLRPSGFLHTVEIGKCGKRELVVTCAALIVTVILCIFPMGLNPMFNGENPQWRNQYEVMTESLLEGHIDIRYDWAGDISKLKNPYDPKERRESGQQFPWDHAYYNGHYYMYFGIVPVFLLFLPFRVVTGIALTTYHATQIFVAFIILGFFALFRQLARRYFQKMTFGMYLSLSMAFSVMSVWYSIGAPALYCTAITAGICMEVWSIYCFFRCVYVEENGRRETVLAVLGALFGALAFGCRPPIALANILVIPMLVYYIRKRTVTKACILRILLAVLPYIIVGVLLMSYNYARFGSPFEFGQTYQLTVADQSNYGSVFQRFSLVDVLNGIYNNFLAFAGFQHTFPYVTFSGALINFPILFLTAGILRRPVRNRLGEHRVRSLVVTLAAVPVIVTLFDVVYSPWLMERYRLDIYYLLGIACYIAIGFRYQVMEEGSRRRYCQVVSILAVLTMLTCFILFIVPNDSNYTQVYPEALKGVKRILLFGL